MRMAIDDRENVKLTKRRERHESSEDDCYVFRADSRFL